MSELARNGEAAVLVSGGVDSAVLCVDLLDRFCRVFPIYVRFGLRWEEAELAALRVFLASAGSTRPGLMPLTVLDEPIEQVYGDHWSNSARPGVPGAETDDSAVYLPGRNLLLGVKAAVWCRLRGIETLAFGVLAANPFADGSAGFFHAFESVLNQGMEGRLRIIRPYARLSKNEVVRRGIALGLPLDLTFSCLNPTDGQHCGGCNKCAERSRALGQIGGGGGGMEPTASATNEVSDPCSG
jgi:7-cyano-7-deazaguanine synthase